MPEMAAALGRNDLPSDGRPDGLRVYDPVLLDALIDDLGQEGEHAREDLLESYVSECSQILAALTEAGNDINGTTLAFVAHKLKSPSATLGLLVLTATASEIEEALRSTPQYVDVRFETARLITEVRRAISALQSLLEPESDQGSEIGATPDLR